MSLRTQPWLDVACAAGGWFWFVPTTTLSTSSSIVALLSEKSGGSDATPWPFMLPLNPKSKGPSGETLPDEPSEPLPPDNRSNSPIRK